jgi:hypothetical protein
MSNRHQVPDEATGMRLVRPVGDDLREYQAMFTEGGAPVIRMTLQRCFIPVSQEGTYGLIDLLDDDHMIVGEIGIDDAEYFQRLRRKLKCRVVDPECAS